MAYKLNVTEHADELLDNLMYHLIYRLKNKQAAKHLLDCIDVIYDRLAINPFQFSLSIKHLNFSRLFLYPKESCCLSFFVHHLLHISL